MSMLSSLSDWMLSLLDIQFDNFCCVGSYTKQCHAIIGVIADIFTVPAAFCHRYVLCVVLVYELKVVQVLAP